MGGIVRLGSPLRVIFPTPAGLSAWLRFFGNGTRWAGVVASFWLYGCGPSPRFTADFSNEMWGKSQFWVIDRMGQPNHVRFVDGEQILVWENYETVAKIFDVSKIKGGIQTDNSYTGDITYFCRITAAVDLEGKVIWTKMDADGNDQACDAIVNRSVKRAP